MPLSRLSKSLIALFIFSSCVSMALAAEPETKLLWPNGAPDAKGDEDGDKPSITIHRPTGEKNAHAAVIVCPGGGYHDLAITYEGHDMAKWFSDRGITGIVLKYRLGGKGNKYQHPAPMHDAQRAIRLTRSLAEELKIDLNKVGLLGFSAGGHLASTVGTHFDDGDKDAKDPIDKLSCRPDFLMLMYPAITMGEFTHPGSKENLIGKNPSPELVELLSNEKHVTSKTPPTFIFQTNGDKVVTAENSLLFVLALRKNKVPVELHLYERGGHGVGMAVKDPVLSTWTKHLEDWLKLRKIL